MNPFTYLYENAKGTERERTQNDELTRMKTLNCKTPYKLPPRVSNLAKKGVKNPQTAKNLIKQFSL